MLRGVKAAIVIGLLAMISCGSASSESVDPLVGTWLFQQLTIAHPDSQTAGDRPMFCVGEITVKPDNTYTARERCKVKNQVEYSEATWENTWSRVGQQQYKANGLDYDLFLSANGTSAVYSSMANDKQIMVGLYEIGWMYKMKR